MEREAIEMQKRESVNFVTDQEGIMEFSICRHGQFKRDWVSIGSVGMSIHFAIVQDANAGRRHVYAASVNDRLPYHLIAIGDCTLKEARAWCTQNAQAVADTIGMGGWFERATITGAGRGGHAKTSGSGDNELDELEAEVKKLEKILAKLKAKANK